MPSSTVRNSLGRLVPTQWRGRSYEPYVDPFSRQPEALRGTRPLVRHRPGDSKLLPTLRAAIEKVGLRDGMTIATHHHLRNGDVLLNLLVREIDAMGIRDIAIASSSVHPVHAEIVPFIRKGTITRCETGVNGLIGELRQQRRDRSADRGPQPRRARTGAHHRRSSGGRRVHRRAVLR